MDGGLSGESLRTATSLFYYGNLVSNQQFNLLASYSGLIMHVGLPTIAEEAGSAVNG